MAERVAMWVLVNFPAFLNIKMDMIAVPTSWGLSWV